MTARTNRTVRIVAGSSAAALVMCTVSLVGAANAAVVPNAPTTGVRPIPTQNPTQANGFQNAPFITNSQQGARVNDFQVTIPNNWKSGDELKVTLPAGVTFASAPTVVVEGPTTQSSINQNKNTQVVQPQDGVRNPTVTSAIDTDPGSNGGAVKVTFTNDASQVVGDNSNLRFVLNFTGVTVNTSTNAQQGALRADVTGVDRFNTAPGSPTPTTLLASTTLAFITDVNLAVTSQPIIPGGGNQTIGNITLGETTQEALVNGTYTLQFTTGPATNPTPVTVLNPDPAGSAFDVMVTGDASLADHTATIGGPSNSYLNLPLTSLNPDGALETFAVSGIRLAPAANSGPIRVTLLKVPNLSNIGGKGDNGTPSAAPGQKTPNFTAINTPNVGGGFPGVFSESRVPNKNGIDAGSIGVLPQDQRIGGNDRYQTAALIAQQLGSGQRDINTFVIASGEPGTDGVDALSANYLAGALAKQQALVQGRVSPVPVLLTNRDRLTDVTAVTIDNLLANRQNQNVKAKIYVVGGTGSVSAAAFAEIQAAAAASTSQASLGNPNLNSGFSVQRVSGGDRYATAASTATLLGESAVGSYVSRFGQGNGNTVFLSNGLAPADALSAGPIAYNSNFPILLTRQGEIPASTVAAMDSDNVKNVILLGGTGSVSDSVVTQLQGLGYTVTRVAGADRFGTNTALYNFANTSTGGTDTNPRGGLGYPAPVTPLLANGLIFPDALTAGPLAAAGTQNSSTGTENDPTKLVTLIQPNSPLLLTSPAALSAPTAAYLSGNRQTITKVTGVGLGGSLPKSVLIAANNAAQSN